MLKKLSGAGRVHDAFDFDSLTVFPASKGVAVSDPSRVWQRYVIDHSDVRGQDRRREQTRVAHTRQFHRIAYFHVGIVGAIDRNASRGILQEERILPPGKSGHNAG